MKLMMAFSFIVIQFKITILIMKGNRSQNDWPSLPPKCENNPVTGIFKITISDLQLFELSPRPITAKLRIWGLKMDSKLFMERTQ